MIRQIKIAIAFVLLLSAGVFAGPFEDGLDAYERGDYATAVKLWTPLAEQGNADAQSFLGYLYMDGNASQDYVEAVKWNRLAARQGDPSSQIALGVMYANGQGVPQDIVYAYMWFNLAAAQDLEKSGIETASDNRDLAASEMTPDQLAEAQRLSRECFASNYENCP